MISATSLMLIGRKAASRAPLTLSPEANLPYLRGLIKVRTGHDPNSTELQTAFLSMKNERLRIGERHVDRR